MICCVVIWIKPPPNKNGISQKYTTRDIITQCKMDSKKDFLCEFGKYVESRGDYVMTKDMTPSRYESISLGPSYDLQGKIKVFCLITGLVLKLHINTVVPMSDQVIKKIISGVREQKEKNMEKCHFSNEPKKISLVQQQTTIVTGFNRG